MNCDFARNNEFTLKVRYVLFLVSTTIPSGNTNFCNFLFSSRDPNLQYLCVDHTAPVRAKNIVFHLLFNGMLIFINQIWKTY